MATRHTFGLRLLVPVALLLGTSAASAVTIDWVNVGDAGNAADTHCCPFFGAVPQVYRISKTEVTNAQYAEFLNAKATADPYGLFNTDMESTAFGGITRSGSSGSFAYSAIAGRENKPVNYVSFYDSLRFSNWLNNGQGSGDTETGSYTITALGITNNSILRNPSANVFLTSEDEWYKAAYYDPVTTSYFDYPAGSSVEPTCALPGSTANTATCNFVASDITDVGSHTGSASPNGTFDQGGNVFEWNESRLLVANQRRRGFRGAGFTSTPDRLGVGQRFSGLPSIEGVEVGFRVASLIPASPAVPSLTPFGITLLLSALGYVGYRKIHVLPLWWA